MPIKLNYSIKAGFNLIDTDTVSCCRRGTKLRSHTSVRKCESLDWGRPEISQIYGIFHLIYYYSKPWTDLWINSNCRCVSHGVYGALCEAGWKTLNFTNFNVFCYIDLKNKKESWSPPFSPNRNILICTQESILTPLKNSNTLIISNQLLDPDLIWI